MGSAASAVTVPATTTSAPWIRVSRSLRSRGRKSRATRARICESARPKASTWPYFVSSRVARQQERSASVKHLKTRYVVALVVIVGAIAWMVTSLSANLNYMVTVSEAVHDRPTKGNDTFRVGGVVKPKSIDKDA